MFGNQRGESGGLGARLRAARARGAFVALALSGLLAGTVVASTATAGPAAAEGHRRPVLLVGGTFSTQQDLDRITFLDDTYDVHRLPLESWEEFWWLGGIPGTASMVQSAQAVRAKVTEILDATGADKVDILGTSQGAVVSRYYIKNLGGADKVAGLVSFGGPHYGIPWITGDPNRDQLYITGCWTFWPPICGEIFYSQAPGDTAFLTALNQPDPTPGRIDYFHIYTETDLANSGEAIPLPGARNVSLQDACPGRQVSHANFSDGAAQELLKAALARKRLRSSCP